MTNSVSRERIKPRALQSYADVHFTYSGPIRRTFSIGFLVLSALLVILALTDKPVRASKNNTVKGVPTDGTCVCNFQASHDYFPVKLTSASTLFSISYHNSYKLITFNSLNSASAYYGESQLTLVAFLCGTPLPSTLLSANPSYVPVEVPIRTSAFASVSDAVLAEMLGVRSTIKFFPAPTKDLDACELKLFNQQETADAADEDMNGGYYYLKPASPAINKAALNSSGYPLDAFFSDGYPSYTTMQGISSQFFSGDATLVPMHGYYEADVFTKLSWINVIAALYNREPVAQDLVANVKARYDCGAQTASAFKNVNLLWFTGEGLGSAYDKSPFYGTHQCASPTSAWYCQILASANITMISVPSSVKTAVQLAQYVQQADLIFVENFDWNLTFGKYGPVFDLNLQTNVSSAKAITSKAVFDIQKTNPAYYFAATAMEPDVLLMDFIQAAHGDAAIQGRTRVFIRNVFTEPVYSGSVNAANCADVNQVDISDWVFSGTCSNAGTLPQELPSPSIVDTSCPGVVPTTSPTSFPTKSAASTLQIMGGWAHIAIAVVAGLLV